MLNQKIIAVVIFIILARGQTGIADLLWDYNVAEDYQRLSEFSSYSPPSLDCCFCLEMDGNSLLVGTSEGVMCWNLQEDKIKIFKTDANWEGEYARTLRDTNEKSYVEKWLSNSVERIVVLSPGQIWVDMFKGVLVIRDGQEVYYASLEEALQSLYNSDLKKLLRKVAAVDINEHLYLLKGKKKGSIDISILKYYDGTVWKEEQSRLCDKGRAFSQKKFIDVAADVKGNIWACGYEGILQRRGNCWDIVEGGGYAKFWLGNDGALWALGWGKLAKLEDGSWKVYKKGQGTYKDFSGVSQYYLSPPPVIFQTPDNRLWFAASINDEGRVVCFDGRAFGQDSFCPLAVTSNSRGQIFVASGERLFSYNKGKWEQISIPYLKKRGAGSSPVEGVMIRDILVSENGTIYVATMYYGVLRYEGGKWDKMSFNKYKIESQSAEDFLSAQIEKAKMSMSESDRFLMTGVGPVPEELMEKIYQAYVEGEGEELIKASDQQLAEHIVQGKDSVSAISYYRLLSRNKKLAKASLHKKIEVMCTSDYGEGWISLEIASYGPPVIEILLKIVKTGTAEQRALAIDSLSFMRNPKVVDGLFDILGDLQNLDSLSYLRFARAAIMVGNPQGMDLLIEAATAERKGEKLNKFRMDDVRRTCREELNRVIYAYDNVPSDWSVEKWKAWWKKHRDTWKPSVNLSANQLLAGFKVQHKVFREVAKRLEANQETYH